MRYLPLLLLFFSYPTLQAQARTVGDELPTTTVLPVDPTQPAFSTDDLRGRAVLLDFWATWCGSCLSSMPHLDTLQNAFADELVVIAVSEEDRDRLNRFRNHTKHDFRFAQDTGSLRKLFPYHTIPHTVLIDPQGKIVAITTPEQITATVIKRVLRGEAIDLLRKQDKLDFDPAVDYFSADSITREAFELQPYHPALPSYTRTYLTGPFRERRLTAYNVTIPSIYRTAYGMSYHRTVLEVPDSLVNWENEKHRFCINLIIAKGEDLYSVLQQKLQDHLPLKVRLERRTQKSIILTRAAGRPFGGERVDQPAAGYDGRGDGFSSEGATLTDLGQYLEDFDILNAPVINETGLTGYYKIDFSFDPENPSSRKTALEQLGLTYTVEEREIEVMIIHQPVR